MTGFVLQDELFPFRFGGSSSSHEFGETIEIHDSFVAVGSPSESVVGSGSGYVAFYERHDNFTPGVSLDDFWIFRDRIDSPDGVAGQEFGAAIAFDEETLVVGAPSSSFMGTNAGAAYVFSRVNDQWQFLARLLPEDITSNDFFGASVALLDNQIIVGASGHDDLASNVGAVYVFEINGGTVSEVGKFHSSLPNENGFFGAALSVDGNRLVASNPGSRYEHARVDVFQYSATGWNHETAVTHPGLFGTGDSFGRTVKLQGSHLIVGSFNEPAGTRPGAVFAFEYDGQSWNYIQTLGNPFTGLAKFGFRVALDGDLFAVQSLNHDTKSLYGFDGTQWVPAGTFSVAPSFPNYTQTIALDGDVVLHNSTICCGGTSVAAHAFNGTAWVQIEFFSSPLVNQQSVQNALLGSAVAISGNTLAATGLNEFAMPTGKGIVYVYQRDDNDTPENPADDAWVPQARLPDPAMISSSGSDEVFGHSLSLTDNMLAVGIPNHTNQKGLQGLVHVYEQIDGAWRKQAEIVPPHPTSFGNFGRSVAIDGNTLVVTGHTNISGPTQNAAYVYERVDGTWQLVHELRYDRFDSTSFERNIRSNIAIYDGAVYIGNPHHSQPVSEAGVVYVLTKEDDNWVHSSSISATSTTQLSENLGYSLAIDGQWLVVGAPRESFTHGSLAGAFYVFRNENGQWNQFAKLSPQGVSAFDFIGKNVAISGNRIVIGNDDNKGIGNFAGAAHVYEFDGVQWKQTSILYAEQERPSEYFGAAVAIQGDEIVIGTPYDSTPVGSGSGSVSYYVANREGVVNRNLFLDDSVHDQWEAGQSAFDDHAVSFFHRPLRPNQAGGFRNVSGARDGITGLMVDLVGASSIELGDFAFRTGTTDDTSSWNELLAPPTLGIRAGEGVSGSDRVTLTWPNGTITNTWLEVTVKANANTGLAEDDVFYFGNQIGDTNGDGLTNATDFAAIRANPSTFLDPAAVDNAFDINRDGLVNALDLLIVREHATTLEGGLPMITPSGPSLAAKADRAKPIVPAADLAGKRSESQTAQQTKRLVDVPSQLDSLVIEDEALEQALRLLAWEQDSPRQRESSTGDRDDAEWLPLEDLFADEWRGL